MTLNWKKSFFILADIALGAYLLLAMTAFNEPDEQKFVCTEVDINIMDGQDDGFLGKTEIREQLKKAKMWPQGQPMKEINIRKMEECISKNPFVDSVECYKTQGGKVKVNLTQRFPVFRVKADNGDDYYVDAQGGIMPNTHYASNQPVATGHISRSFAQKRLSRIGNHIMHHEFWNSVVEQVNVLDDGTIEMVPRIGDHIVYLGAPIDIPQKLDRLEKFYRYGLSMAGWNKYSYISLEFDNQIICKRKRK